MMWSDIIASAVKEIVSAINRKTRVGTAVEIMKLYHTTPYAHRPAYDEALNIVKQELGVPNVPTK